MNRFLRAIPLLAAALCIAGGCEDGDMLDYYDDLSDGGIVTDEEALMQYKTFGGATVSLWPNGRVPVCFNGRATSQEAGWLKSALADNWAQAAKLDFVYSDTCPFPGEAYHIQVNWVSDTGWGVGGTCYPGRSNPTIATLGYCPTCGSAVDYMEAFKSAVVHELGHGLGFAHEHQRADRTPPAGCLPPKPVRSSYTTDKAYQDALGAWEINIQVISDGIYLTSWYDPDSIMNYCRGITSSNPTVLAYMLNYQAADRISVGDLYGAQALYGKRFPYWLDLPVL